ncbi:MAG: enoyl-CoA hydratase/isomerase family protein, partial [Deltaproteobacteria bacterium]|nr:enoyl-CoA hydratase/isomerase family protein [Deltaproteobacteria bacterium]
MKTDFKTIAVEVKEGVGVFTMNNPPVNQLSQHFVEELAQAISEAYVDDAIQAIVLTGIGKNFIAGADITQILGI